MSNILIVESHNDKFFIEALINHINSNLKVEEPICNINEFECLGGINKLEEKLNSIEHKILKGEIKKIGIIFDADNIGIKDRKQQIEEKIKLFKEKLPEECRNINFLIHILNVEGHGELETILKTIKSQDSTIADCLESWENCLPEDKKLKKKDFDKFWVQVYQRYDCCNKKEAKQADKKCNNEISLKEKNIWNFDHSILNDLKEFLQKLGEEQ
jgi:hypothetical protein